MFNKSKFDKAFNKFDVNKSGGICKSDLWVDTIFYQFVGVNEIRALLVELGHEVTEARLQEIFTKFDVDKSGELCKKEVRAMVDELKERVIFS
mgnify:CR=1 FL=1